MPLGTSRFKGKPARNCGVNVLANYRNTVVAATTSKRFRLFGFPETRGYKREAKSKREREYTSRRCYKPSYSSLLIYRYKWDAPVGEIILRLFTTRPPCHCMRHSGRQREVKPPCSRYRAFGTYIGTSTAAER